MQHRVENPLSLLTASRGLGKVWLIIALFFGAQLISTAHGYEIAGDLGHHNSSDCVLCLTGDRSADAPAAPDLVAPALVFGVIDFSVQKNTIGQKVFYGKPPVRGPPTL